MPCGCVYNDRKIWGRQLWALIHYLPIKLNNLQKVPQMIDFIKNLYLALPCDECHKHCKEYMEKNQIVLSGPNDLNACKKDIAKFLYDFHNHVNSFTQKPLFMSFEDYQKTQPPQPDMGEIRKIFDNGTNRNFFNTFLTPIQRQYGNTFLTTFGLLG